MNKKITLFFIGFLLTSSISFSQALVGGEIENDGQTEVEFDQIPNDMTSKVGASGGVGTITYYWLYGIVVVPGALTYWDSDPIDFDDGNGNDVVWTEDYLPFDKIGALGPIVEPKLPELNDALGSNLSMPAQVQAKRVVIDGNGDKAESNIITLTVKAQTTAAVDVVDGVVVNLYPNPARNRAHFPTDLFESIEIFNSVGQKVGKYNGGEGFIDTSSLETGLYYVKMLKENASVTKKLLIE